MLKNIINKASTVCFAIIITLAFFSTNTHYRIAFAILLSISILCAIVNSIIKYRENEKAQKKYEEKRDELFANSSIADNKELQERMIESWIARFQKDSSENK